MLITSLPNMDWSWSLNRLSSNKRRINLQTRTDYAGNWEHERKKTNCISALSLYAHNWSTNKSIVKRLIHINHTRLLMILHNFLLIYLNDETNKMLQIVHEKKKEEDWSVVVELWEAQWKIRSCLRVIFIDPCWAHEITKLNIRMRFQKCDDMRRNDVEKDVKLNLMAEKSQLFPFPSNRIVSKRTDKRCVPFFFLNDYVYCSLDIIVLEITDGNSIHCSLFVVLFVQSFFFLNVYLLCESTHSLSNAHIL